MNPSQRMLARWAVFALSLVVVERSSACGQESTDPLKQTGAFQRMAAPINKLLELRWEKDRVRLVRDDDADRLEAVFGEIQQQAGTHSAGSSSGGDRRSRRFEGSTLKGELELSRAAGRRRFFGDGGDRGGRWASMRLVLREVASPSRHLTVDDDGTGALSITLTGESNDHWLRFRQRANGSVLIQEIRGEELFAAQADSLMALAAKEPKYIEEKFMPLLKHVGFVPTVMPSDPRVQAAVLAMLRPAGADDAGEFNRLVAQLGDRTFQTREQATRTLAARYERYKPLLVKASADKSLAPEALQRIKKLLLTADKTSTAGLERLIEVRGLTTDPEYVVTLLASAKDDDDRRLLVAQLEKISGQKLGADVAAWRNWLSRRGQSSK